MSDYGLRVHFYIIAEDFEYFRNGGVKAIDGEKSGLVRYFSKEAEGLLRVDAGFQDIEIKTEINPDGSNTPFVRRLFHMGD